MRAPVQARHAELTDLRRLHERAVDASHTGRQATAERLLRDGIASLDQARSREEITLRMRMLITLAKVESELRDVDAGLTRLEEAVALLEHRPDPVVLTALHNQRGALLARAGRYTEALTCFDEAERHFASASERDRVAVLLNRPTIRMLMGNLRGATADFERSLRIAERNDLTVAREMVLHNLGYLRFLLGDLPAALAAMSEAVAEGSTRDQVALLDRARVLLESGLFREADETLAAAAEVARRERLTQDLGEIELERARCALIAGDVAAARRSALSARARFRRRGSDGWRRSAEVLLLQSDLAAGRPGRRLIEPALQVRREFDLLGLRQQARAAALIAAEAAVDAGDVAQATSLVAEVGRPAAGDPITARLHARFVRAAIRNARGEAAAASREARAGLADLAAYQARFGSIELQAAAAIHGRRLADLDVSIALDGGRAERVLRAAEFARAASNRLPVVRPPGDREAADLLTELRQTAESMRSTQDRDEWIALQGRRRRLEARIASRGWTLEGPGESREVSSVEEIAATAGRLDTALIAFVQSSGGLHAVVVDESLRLRALGPAAPVAEYVRRARADLDVLAQPMLPGPMRAAVLASFQRSMRDLDAALLAPLGVDGRRLVVVSTGVLGQLPWGALPSLTGVPVVVAPSATAWLAAVRARRSRRRRVVVLSGPGVAHADRESKGVAAAWSAADLRTGQAADRRALVTALGGASVVHVAAHGVHNTENAMFSSLRMADGPVFAHELDRTHRTAEHVVLSACELGLATVRPGDEALGLTSVLLRLGTRSVVAGVARVNDEVAAEVMTAYHRALAGGADSAGALAAAVAGTAGAGAAEVAPFVCFGSAWRGPARPAGPKAPRS